MIQSKAALVTRTKPQLSPSPTQDRISAIPLHKIIRKEALYPEEQAGKSKAHKSSCFQLSNKKEVIAGKALFSLMLKTGWEISRTHTRLFCECIIQNHSNIESLKHKQIFMEIAKAMSTKTTLLEKL